MENIDAMHAVVERELHHVFKGPFELDKLGEQASGMLVDRPQMIDALERIENGCYDAVAGSGISVGGSRWSRWRAEVEWEREAVVAGLFSRRCRVGNPFRHYWKDARAGAAKPLIS